MYKSVPPRSLLWFQQGCHRCPFSLLLSLEFHSNLVNFLLVSLSLRVWMLCKGRALSCSHSLIEDLLIATKKYSLNRWMGRSSPIWPHFLSSFAFHRAPPTATHMLCTCTCTHTCQHPGLPKSPWTPFSCFYHGTVTFYFILWFVYANKFWDPAWSPSARFLSFLRVKLSGCS